MRVTVPTTVIAMLIVSWCGAEPALAQTPELVFTVAVPQPTTQSQPVLHAAAVAEERGLALWSGTASDFGVGVTLSSPRWTVRSISSMTVLPRDHHDQAVFQQVEIVRPLLTRRSFSAAGGGGVRQEWDGTSVLIGRVLAGTDIGSGRLQGSLVLERALSSPIRRDAADVVTSVGWSHGLTDRISLGIEGIGQDIEGLWNRAEAEGGAKLLVGPSLHAQSTGGTWTASLTAGPVVQTFSTMLPQDGRQAPPHDTAHHFGIFASASWVPSFGR